MPAPLTKNDSQTIAFVAEVLILTVVCVPTLIYITGYTSYTFFTLLLATVIGVSVITATTRGFKQVFTMFLKKA